MGSSDDRNETADNSRSATCTARAADPSLPASAWWARDLVDALVKIGKHGQVW